MNDRDARDRDALTLLVQLFGREVLDRLARAGFNDEAAIARAGSERLAAESGIPAPVAQRIVAVVEETHRSVPADAPREPRRRKAPAARPALKAPAKRPAPSPGPADPDRVDPFVDDVALVAWMGFSSKTPAGRASFSVADGILDPVRRESPAQEEARRISKATAPASPSISSATGTITQAPEDQAPDGQDGPRPASSHTLPGSFWSFGRSAKPRNAPDDVIARPPGRKPDSEAPASAPPRRDRHDH